jgi:hypothetical protein
MIDKNHEKIQKRFRSERSANCFVAEFNTQTCDVREDVSVQIWNQHIKINLKTCFIFYVTKMLLVNMADFSTEASVFCVLY